MNTLNVCSRRRTGATGFVAPRAATGLEWYRALCARSQQLIAGGSAPAPWVAFFCSAKRKPRKKRPPGALVASRYEAVPSVPHPTGRSTNSPGAKQRASGSNTVSLKTSRWSCGTRRALRGLEKNQPPRCSARDGEFENHSDHFSCVIPLKNNQSQFV